MSGGGCDKWVRVCVIVFSLVVTVKRDYFNTTSVVFDTYLIGFLNLCENELNEEVCV